LLIKTADAAGVIAFCTEKSLKVPIFSSLV